MVESKARRFWRAIEHEAEWACRHGLAEVDRHPTLREAIEHLSAIAEAQAPSQIFAHYLNGRVETVAVFD
jgi:hypothetical protein